METARFLAVLGVRLALVTMTTAEPPASSFIHLVVGYDGSPPASRALDAALRLLQGRTGSIEVVYVAHLSSMVMLSADAIAEMEQDFGEVEQELRAQAAEQLSGHTEAWGFQRRQGVIAEELVAAATGLQEADAAGTTVVIVVGSSSSAAHRLVGSVAVSLARHSPVPLVIVP
jgi:nucleotide-binding universal stress UspA family protein